MLGAIYVSHELHFGMLIVRTRAGVLVYAMPLEMA